MNVQEMAINKRTALMMFWNAGISDMPNDKAEVALNRASDKLDSMHQPTAGYWDAKTFQLIDQDGAVICLLSMKVFQDAIEAYEGVFTKVIYS